MDTAPELVTLKPETCIAIRAKVALAELPAFFGAAFGELGAHAGDQVAGPAFARYFTFAADGVDVEAIVPIRAPIAVSGRVRPIDLPGGRAVQIRHVGSYSDLGGAYRSIEGWLDDHHEQRADAIREVYLTAPTVVSTDQITLLIQPINEKV